MVISPHLHKTKKGLQIVLAPDNSTEAVALLIVTRAGSRFESDDLAGMSHFLEHMYFTGTTRRPSSNAIAKEIDALGAEFNAHPSEETVSYHIKSASEHLEKTIDIFSDMLVNSRFDLKDIKKEKKVVVEEVKLHQDMPTSEVFDLFSEALFAGTPLGKRVGGTIKTVGNFNREKLLENKKLLYSSNRTYICVSGNFGKLSPGEVVKMVESKFDFSTSDFKDQQKLKLSAKKFHHQTKDTNQTNFVIGNFGPSYSAKDRLATRLLTIILGGAMSSRLFQEIREKRGLAYDIRTSGQFFSDIGAIYTSGGVANNKVGETLLEVINQYQKIKKDLSREEVEAAKSFMIGQTKIAFEDSLNLAEFYLNNLIFTGNIKTKEEVFAEVESITFDQVLSAAKKYLDENNLTLALVGPEAAEKQVKRIIKT
ncbi:MAG: peptidase M16 domain-containing protein [Candidatus Berkelbacteria bacterium Athens1014_28]|uniref:Peptidase M16 domain-containing protein n=1 Tax=Candidatus Berkelbacteria bacterium Athens1014_28 TaxID=2017145 RepID=A0A554LKS8_9BACT|nr:MAG: peptidase M16 domain-containing protein [Candidatus Berkelbacteria bacterium Athens1014_28]